MGDTKDVQNMKRMKMIFFKLIEIICCSIFVFFLLLLSGCAGKTEVLPFAVNYKIKQIRFADSSINYVVCRDCIQYTRVQDFQNYRY